MDRDGRGHPGLDPARDPARWESVVGGIMKAAGPELRRRHDQVDLTGALLEWARPALSAAATIALLLSVSLAVARGASTAVAAEPLLASALVPEEVAAWLVQGYQPTVTEVVVALEEVVR